MHVFSFSAGRARAGRALPLFLALGLVASAASCGGRVQSRPEPSQYPTSRGPEAGPHRPGQVVPPGSRPASARAPQVRDWEAFRHASAALDARIASVSGSLRSGSSPGAAGRLASLRLAARGRDLIIAGKPESAIDVLERALASSGNNGFADLYLSYAHHQLGHSRNALEFARRAQPSLPRDPWVLAELEGLRASIRASNPGLPAR